MNYTCSLIVRSFNEEKYIGRLFEGIKKQTLYRYHCQDIRLHHLSNKV